jgi:hypothetical protein
MGCCQARPSKMEENFFTIGLCFLFTTEMQIQFKDIDKMTLRYFERHQGIPKDKWVEALEQFYLGEATMSDDDRQYLLKLTKVLNKITGSLESYHTKITLELEEAKRTGSNKKLQVGKKYTSEAAIAQIESFVTALNKKIFTILKDGND